MDLAMKLADWDGFGNAEGGKKRGKLLGLGLSNYVESSIGSPRERTEITVRPEGRVDVVIGTQPSGQGHETSFAQVVADLSPCRSRPSTSSSATPTSQRRRRFALRLFDAPRRQR
jgi:CO/xanthine dehydrogenase Mo-binding subunit